METLQVQSAGAVAPTLPASTVVSGTSNGENTFALTFGRALENMPNSVQDGASIAPKASPRGKRAAGDNSDPSSMAGILPDCFVTNSLQPAPAVARSIEALDSTASLQSPTAEPRSDSPPNFALRLNSAGETSVNTGTLSIPAPMVGVAASGTLFAWAGNGVGTTATPKAEAPKPTAREQDEAAIQSASLVSTIGQNPSQDTPAPQSVSVPSVFPGLQSASLLSPSVEPPVGGALSKSKQAQTSSPWSMQESGSRQESQNSPGLMDSSPLLEQLDPPQMQAGPLPASSQDLQASPNPTQLGGQTEPASPAFSPEAGNSSALFSAADHPELAEFSSLLGKFSGANLPAVSNSMPSPGQVGQDAAALGPGPRDSSTPVSATDHPEMAEFSTLVGKLASGQIDLKVSGNVMQSTTTDRFTTKSTPVVAGTLTGSLSKTALDAVQIPPASKAENPVDTPAKGTLHSVQISSSVVGEVAGQTGNRSEAASTPAPLSSSAGPVASPQLDTSPHPATAATTLQKDPAPEADSQLSSAAYTNSGDSGAHTNLADASTSGQGKSGQQSGTGPGDDPKCVMTFAPSIATNPAPDPTANLLTAQAPSVPTSHANTSAPQTLPSPSQPATTLSAWQNYDGGAGNIVRSASLNGSATGAEMHVELRSGTLGPVEVHAVVHEGSVGAEIHVQGQEAHTLLAAGLPSLERALGERNLRVENIAVYQDQTGGGMSGGEKQDPTRVLPHHRSAKFCRGTTRRSPAARRAVLRRMRN